ncbi:MAG: hypothetical protein ACHQNA_06245 [Acidimicrobiales bacterium]
MVRRLVLCVSVVLGLAVTAGCSSTNKSIASANAGGPATAPTSAAPASSPNPQQVCTSLKAASVAFEPFNLGNLAGVTSAQSAQLHAAAANGLPDLQSAQAAATGSLATDLGTVITAINSLLAEPASANQPAAVLTTPSVQAAWTNISAYATGTCGFNPASPNG